ncbi:MAG TPA: hypothetical protein PKD53_00535 [Chloroflexaceae bacterium]|nr:hypothetical protein [Chloroflexaceae bacterium]
MATLRQRPWQPKRSGTWDRMPHRARAAWLASLTDPQLVTQARVRAQAAQRSVGDILIAWVLNGLITYEHRLALHAALTGLATVTPAAFYDLDRTRQGLALALLGDEERFAFAAACGAYLGDLYATRVPAQAVMATWARVGLIGGAR